jgi:hypothetical protein
MPQECPKATLYFPNPWEYLDVPREDINDLLQLYKYTYLENVDTLPKALEALTYHHDSPFGRKYAAETQGQQAMQAAMFFIVCDFVAMKYARFHPTFVMKPIPKEVLAYLKPPFNQMVSLDIEDQRRFRASLPPEQQEAVYIDE